MLTKNLSSCHFETDYWMIALDFFPSNDLFTLLDYHTKYIFNPLNYSGLKNILWKKKKKKRRGYLEN